MHSSSTPQSPGMTSPTLPQLIPCVTSEVAVQDEKERNDLRPPMSERDKPADLSALSDADLQDYIHACAKRFLAAQERWNATGDFAAIGDRDCYWHEEAAALRERASRPHLVLAMEKERGLA